MTPTALVFAATVVLAMLPVVVRMTSAAAQTSGRGSIAAAFSAQSAPGYAGAGEDKLPNDTFHVAYKGIDDASDVDISLELIASRSDRKISGVFQMMRPVKMWSHVSGSYAQSSPMSPDVVSLDGLPTTRSCGPSTGHGRPVFENARISLRIEPGWQGGTADLSYPPGTPGVTRASHLKWVDISGIKVSGGVLTHWRGVTDLEYTGRTTVMPWPTTCTLSSRRLRSELERAGRDGSSRDLGLRSTVDPNGAALIQWFVHNSSGNHILARYVCGNKSSPIDDQIVQIYPFEDFFLIGFFTKDTCQLETSHFD